MTGLPAWFNLNIQDYTIGAVLRHSKFLEGVAARGRCSLVPMDDVVASLPHFHNRRRSYAVHITRAALCSRFTGAFRR